MRRAAALSAKTRPLVAQRTSGMPRRLAAATTRAKSGRMVASPPMISSISAPAAAARAASRSSCAVVFCGRFRLSASMQKAQLLLQA